MGIDWNSIESIINTVTWWDEKQDWCKVLDNLQGTPSAKTAFQYWQKEAIASSLLTLHNLANSAGELAQQVHEWSFDRSVAIGIITVSMVTPSHNELGTERNAVHLAASSSRRALVLAGRLQ